MWRVGFVYKKDKNGGAKQNSETQDTHTYTHNITGKSMTQCDPILTRPVIGLPAWRKAKRG